MAVKRMTKTGARSAKPSPGKKPVAGAAKPASPVGKSVLEEWTGKGGVRGRITLSDQVVAAIAGLTAQKVAGIHALGKSSLIPFRGKSPARGVEAEVGAKEVALDIEVIIEHGCDIRQTAKELHRSIVADVDQMTGRKVVELNLDIVGIALPPAEQEEPAAEPPRRVR